MVLDKDKGIILGMESNFDSWEQEDMGEEEKQTYILHSGSIEEPLSWLGKDRKSVV